VERGWEALWRGDGGYPAVAWFHEGRLILGNFVRARSVFAYSVINSPFNFSMGDGTAADGGWRILSLDQGEAVHHIVSEHGLYFFSAAAGNTPLTRGMGRQLGRAIIRHDSDGSIYLFQRNNVSLSEFRYSDDRVRRRTYPATAGTD
jgi:hypothetical protein